jgi:plasmid stabilization system protein ParE
MDRFDVIFSRRFDDHINALEQSSLHWGQRQTSAYIQEILLRCESLEVFPMRYAEIDLDGYQLRAFAHKAHRIFYRIDFNSRRVIFIA